MGASLQGEMKQGFWSKVEGGKEKSIAVKCQQCSQNLLGKSRLQERKQILEVSVTSYHYYLFPPLSTHFSVLLHVLIYL